MGKYFLAEILNSEIKNKSQSRHQKSLQKRIINQYG